MAKRKRDPRTDAPDDAEPLPQTDDRSTELCEDEELEKAAQEVLADVLKGFSNQWDRSNQILDFWDIYHCVLGPKQFYSGNSKIFLPIVHDAVNARKTRFVNQIFPQSGKHVEVTGSEDKPQGLESLLEFYIRKTKMRTKVLPGLSRNGDMEGQYTVLMSWIKNERHVASRVKKKPTVEGDLEVDGEEYEDIEEQTIEHAYPGVEVIPDSDLLVLPVTAESIEAALAEGGSVTVVRRWSKAKIKRMIAEEEIDKARGEKMIEQMSQKEKQQIPDKKDAIVNALGIQTKGSKAPALCFMTYTMLALKNEEGELERRLCRIYFGSDEIVLSIKRNPYWCDKCPILSAPVEKEEGCFKGAPKIKFVETIQYAANDAINEGMDSAAYALLPIIMTDPAKNPRVGSMVLNVAAVWEVDPRSTQFAQFPQLWKEAFQIVQSAKDQIFQTLGVNPAMMPQQTMAPGKKPNQAQIANEQQIDIMTTADVVTTLEGEILSPMLQWFVYLDHQFREQDITIRAFGRLGVQMDMEKIEPVQMDRRFEFRWYGVEAARNAQQMQIQMSGLNAMRSIPQQMYPGYEINLAPAIQQFMENLFGPRLAALIFTDIRQKMTLEAKFENQLLASGFDLPVQPLDDDQEHMKEHAQAMQESPDGDASGVFRAHMIRHQINMQKKMQAQQMAQQPQPQQQPGGGGPRPGAQAQKPRSQGPAGMIPQDRFAMGMPRTARG